MYVLYLLLLRFRLIPPPTSIAARSPSSEDINTARRLALSKSRRYAMQDVSLILLLSSLISVYSNVIRNPNSPTSSIVEKIAPLPPPTGLFLLATPSLLPVLEAFRRREGSLLRRAHRTRRMQLSPSTPPKSPVRPISEVFGSASLPFFSPY